jgi:hypothetical protein
MLPMNVQPAGAAGCQLQHIPHHPQLAAAQETAIGQRHQPAGRFRRHDLSVGGQNQTLYGVGSQANGARNVRMLPIQHSITHAQ